MNREEERRPPAHDARSALRQGESLADVLERVLDTGIVIAGDIQVNLLDIELLTIRIRLLITSADKAEELGMAWWRQDPWYRGLPSGGNEQGAISHQLDEMLEQQRRLGQRLDELEDLPSARIPGRHSSKRSS